MNNIKLKRKKRKKKNQKNVGATCAAAGVDWISIFFFSSHSVQSTQPKMKWPIVFLFFFFFSLPVFSSFLVSPGQLLKKKGKNRRRKT